MDFTLGRCFCQLISHRKIAVVAIIGLTTLTATPPALAQTENILYNFCSLANCADGKEPQAGVIADAEGNLYGTTTAGGAYQRGTVYMLSPEGTETVLHSFGGTATDGSYPVYGQLLMHHGNLYGTTSAGGMENGGTVFRVSPSGVEEVLHNFCSAGGSACSDGKTPWSNVIVDKEGNLYGTTVNGGTDNAGVVFKLTPDGTETALYRFSGGTDGGYPESGLVMDSEGNLYGTTYGGGDLNFCDGFGCGTVYEITPPGAESVLHSFCSADNSICTDGFDPIAGLILAKGSLYGTTKWGGKDGYGTVFRLSLSGKEGTALSFTVGGVNGELPDGPVTMDRDGNIYGTTSDGGSGIGNGIVFEISNTGTGTVLHYFNCSSLDGCQPTGSLLLNSSGNLIGTTLGGGTQGEGTVFEITP